MKVQVDLEHLKTLAKVAKINGTQNAFIDLAIEWAEICDRERVAALIVSQHLSEKIRKVEEA